MSRISYVGPDPVAPEDLASQLEATNIFDSAPTNRSGVGSSVDTAAALLGDKNYIDTQDAQFPSADYYQTRDALNVPVSLKGQPNGVASLDATGKIPVVQIPNMGVGYLHGPFGPTAVYTATNATATPVKIAEFAIGTQNLAFRPLVYTSVICDTIPGGRPVLEMRISDGAAAYASQTLIAQGIGRPIYSGRQVVACNSASDTLGANGTGSYGTSMNIVASLYVYSTTTTGVTVGSAGVVSAAIFLLRTAP